MIYRIRQEGTNYYPQYCPWFSIFRWIPGVWEYYEHMSGYYECFESLGEAQEFLKERKSLREKYNNFKKEVVYHPYPEKRNLPPSIYS